MIIVLIIRGFTQGVSPNQPKVENNTKTDASVYTDECHAYEHLSETGRSHSHVNHSQGEWARDDDVDGVREVHCNTEGPPPWIDRRDIAYSQTHIRIAISNGRCFTYGSAETYGSSKLRDDTSICSPVRGSREATSPQTPICQWLRISFVTYMSRKGSYIDS